MGYFGILVTGWLPQNRPFFRSALLYLIRPRVMPPKGLFMYILLTLNCIVHMAEALT
jgi:hypothetical protein